MKRFVHMHHMHWWELGGPTNLDNLITLCTFHHKLVHEHGWSVALRGRSPVWFRPSGRRFEAGPAPPRCVKLQPEPPESSDDTPWPAMWHWLHGDDSDLAKDASISRFLKFAAHTIEWRRFGDGDMHFVRARDDAAGVVLADDSSSV
jgi:hypothetical protein